MEKVITWAIASVVGVAVFCGILLVAPVFAVAVGYIAGLAVMWVFGGIVTEGLNILFGTPRFAPNHIPLICATLALIGSFFSSAGMRVEK